jgi:hypothetical protein
MCATKNENIAQIFFRVFKPLFPNLFTLGMSIEQWNNLDLTAMRMDLNPAIEALEALPEPTGSVPAEEEKKEKPYTLTDRQLEYCEIKAYSDGDDIIKSDGLRWLANKIWGEKKEHDTTGTDHSRWLSKNAKNNVKIKRHPDNGDWWIFTPEKDCFKPAKQGRPRIHN